MGESVSRLNCPPQGLLIIVLLKALVCSEEYFTYAAAKKKKKLSNAALQSLALSLPHVHTHVIVISVLADVINN